MSLGRDFSAETERVTTYRPEIGAKRRHFINSCYIQARNRS